MSISERALERSSAPFLGALHGEPYASPWRCLVVLPTYDEKTNLRNMVAAIGKNLVTDILVVDDNSPDGTGALADELARSHAHIHVMHRTGKLGLGTAYIAGFRWGLARHYDRVIQMDCDFSHDPASLRQLVAASGTADVVIGSRYVAGGSTQGWNRRRRLLSRMGNLYSRIFLGGGVRDWTAGFRCLSREILEKVDLDKVDCNGYAFQIQLTHLSRRAGAKVHEVPICFVDRREGQSKMGTAIALEAIRKVPSLRMQA